MIENACECCQGANGELTQEEAELYQQLDEIIAAKKDMQGCMIPILQDTQELFGYLPEGAMRKIAYELEVPYSEVTGVVGFYSFFSTIPRGKHLIRVCMGTACYVRGGKEVLDMLEKKLQIQVGQTTDDNLFSLDIGRCFGACGLAPVIMIDDETFQRVRPAKLEAILEEYQVDTEETA